AMYPFRAVEHRVAVVRAANTGVSAFIAPTGKIVRRIPLYERTTAAERVPLRSRVTLYSRLGDWLAELALAVSAAALPRPPGEPGVSCSARFRPACTLLAGGRT